MTSIKINITSLGVVRNSRIYFSILVNITHGIYRWNLDSPKNIINKVIKFNKKYGTDIECQEQQSVGGQWSEVECNSNCLFNLPANEINVGMEWTAFRCKNNNLAKPVYMQNANGERILIGNTATSSINTGYYPTSATYAPKHNISFYIFRYEK
ncbi:hypothetical protein [Campylobacter hyointestinalis]|uniref:hypothetical protein n=1 Tax=Campylobacter hyointestinalis TaxID=198 RepID=UPI0011ABDBF8|nr:hypothetical protein [Campylobacter hyointestinalis]TWO28052.1 hypothetical protein YZ79_09295 [Campylobacter hyointestinalis]